MNEFVVSITAIVISSGKLGEHLASWIVYLSIKQGLEGSVPIPLFSPVPRYCCLFLQALLYSKYRSEAKKRNLCN